MFWDGLRIKATPFAGVRGMHSVQLVVAVIGKKTKPPVLLHNKFSLFGHSDYKEEV